VIVCVLCLSAAVFPKSVGRWWTMRLLLGCRMYPNAGFQRAAAQALSARPVGLPSTVGKAAARLAWMWRLRARSVQASVGVQALFAERAEWPLRAATVAAQSAWMARAWAVSRGSVAGRLSSAGQRSAYLCVRLCRRHFER